MMGTGAIQLLAIWVGVSWALLNLPLPRSWRNVLFSALAVGGNYLCLFRPAHASGAFALVVGFVLFFFLAFRFQRADPDSRILYALALLAPIVFLVLAKAGKIPMLLGFSYLTFRLLQLVAEVDAGRAEAPGLVEYLGFAFFPLTFVIGPINPLAYHQPSLNAPDRAVTPLPRSLERILAGMVKVYLVASFFKTMDASNFLLDGHLHGLKDVAIAAACTYLFLYFNLSGASDVAIGAAGILNIHVKENFDNPLAARNLKDFWNRYHITLSHLLRDLLFTPGVVWLSRSGTDRAVHLAVITMTLVTFLAIGLWHGFARNFAVVGLLHGVGLSVFYLFTVMHKRLPDRLRAITGSAVWTFAATALTFAYVSFTCLFFANDWAALRQILSVIRLS